MKKNSILCLSLFLIVFSLTCCSYSNRNQKMLTTKTSFNLLTLVDYHNPILRQKANPIKFPLSEQDKQLIQDMKYSIQKDQLQKANAPFDSAAGMAANQWGSNKRIFLFCPTGDAINGLEVVINPSYEPIVETATNLPTKELSWEGCFSVPLATGSVERYKHIKVKYQNEEGKTIVRQLSDWEAKVWQHENDHLNGLLYDDINAKKCIDKKQFKSIEELNKFYSVIREERKNLIDCPCGTKKLYKDCCGKYLTKESSPILPEELMRSRYTAFVKKNMDYIKETMQGPALLKFNNKGVTHNPEQWLGLEIINSYYGSNPDVGYVEFIAKYKDNNIERHIHELSEFNRIEGRWYYVDGKYM